MDYQTYPNILGHVRGDLSRGGKRVGTVVENADTERAGTAGFPAMVTHEEGARVRFYIFMTETEVPMWQGPYHGLSEEIIEMEMIN